MGRLRNRIHNQQAMGSPTSYDRREPIRSRPTFGTSKAKQHDQRVSVCSDCRRGIFEFHEYIWTNRGLVHTECNDETETTT